MKIKNNMKEPLNTTPEPEKLTKAQFDSLHLWFELLAQELQNRGLTMNGFIKYPINPTKESVKQLIFKPILEATFGKKSTKELSKKREIDNCIDSIVVMFADMKSDIVVPNFPSQEETESYLKSLTSG